MARKSIMKMLQRSFDKAVVLSPACGASSAGGSAGGGFRLSQQTNMPGQGAESSDRHAQSNNNQFDKAAQHPGDGPGGGGKGKLSDTKGDGDLKDVLGKVLACLKTALNRLPDPGSAEIKNVRNEIKNLHGLVEGMLSLTA